MITDQNKTEGLSAKGEKNLWSKNNPMQFWQVQSEIDPETWKEAIIKASEKNGLPLNNNQVDNLLHYTLGEGRFGENHWDLSLFNRMYWWLKPILPHRMIRKARKIVHRMERKMSWRNWPIDDGYTCFQWDIMRQLLEISGKQSVLFKDFWPDYHQYAFVLTHDVESTEAQSYIPRIADLEEKKGFRSLFNIVGDQIPNDLSMLHEIADRGFEIGLHGWHHNDWLYQSRNNFIKGAVVINEKLRTLDAVGFRSPLNLRHPEWMQALNIEYDLSFFDTDPFEPIPGGTMCVWPFKIGHFTELPATLVQDNTLISLLGDTTPKVWLDKVDFLQKFHGMALLNSHPDYLVHQPVWNVYEQFLDKMRENDGYWHALPREVARWWCQRMDDDGLDGSKPFNLVEAKMTDDQLAFGKPN